MKLFRGFRVLQNLTFSTLFADTLLDQACVQDFSHGLDNFHFKLPSQRVRSVSLLTIFASNPKRVELLPQPVVMVGRHEIEPAFDTLCRKAMYHSAARVADANERRRLSRVLVRIDR